MCTVTRSISDKRGGWRDGTKSRRAAANVLKMLVGLGSAVMGWAWRASFSYEREIVEGRNVIYGDAALRRDVAHHGNH